MVCLVAAFEVVLFEVLFAAVVVLCVGFVVFAAAFFVDVEALEVGSADVD